MVYFVLRDMLIQMESYSGLENLRRSHYHTTTQILQCSVPTANPSPPPPSASPLDTRGTRWPCGAKHRWKFFIKTLSVVQIIAMHCIECIDGNSPLKLLPGEPSLEAQALLMEMVQPPNLVVMLVIINHFNDYKYKIVLSEYLHHHLGR